MRYARKVLLVLGLLALVVYAWPSQVGAQIQALNRFLGTTGSSNDNILEINGTLEFEDKVTVIDHGAQTVTGGYATLTTNLSGGITDCTLTLKSAAAGTAPGLDPYTVTAVTTTGSAVLDIHVWKATSSSNPTLLRTSTQATVGYHCFGAD